MINKYLILGSGGGGRTVVSILEAYALKEKISSLEISFLDDSSEGRTVNGYPVIGPVSKATDDSIWPEETGFIVAFGSMHLPARETVFSMLQNKGRNIINAIHPNVTIDRWAHIGVGNVISSNCVIHPNAILGDNCFLCVAVTIDHDNNIGNNVYLSPGVNLAGGVIIEDNVFLGISAAVLPGVCIGKAAIIGAGAVVIRDVAAGATVVGVPARQIKIREEIDL